MKVYVVSYTMPGTGRILYSCRKSKEKAEADRQHCIKFYGKIGLEDSEIQEMEVED